MKKKFGSLLLAGIMACTMTAGVAFSTGCGSVEDSGFVMPDDGFDTETPVTIKFYHTMNQDIRKVLQEYIEIFNGMYPNVTIVEDQIGGYEDVRDQVTTEISSDTGDYPDIAYCYPDHVALFNQSGKVVPLNGFLPDGEFKDMKVKQADETEVSLNLTQAEKDSLIKGYYEEGFKFGDETKMYTLPFAKSTEVMYYNKTFFEKNNLSVPTTWTEMESTCKRILEIDPNCTPLGYDSEANLFITMCEQYGSPYTSSDGEFLFDNAKNREFVKMFSDWYNAGYFTTQELNGQYTSNKFKNQTSYMCIGSSAGAKNQSPDRVDGVYPFEIGISPIPQVNPSNPKVISQGPSVCILNHDNEPQRVLASWLFVKFLLTNVTFQARFSSIQGYVPVLTLETMQTNATYKENLEKADGYGNVTFLAAKVCMEQESAYYTSPAFVGSAKARDEVGSLIQSVLSKSKSLDQAFRDAIEECEYFAN